MEIERTESFEQDFGRLSDSVKRRIEKALRLLASDFRHPSLRARITDKKRRIWKANIDGGYRLTFQIVGDTILLRRVGVHGVMERPERW
jgi:mRNA-degrading endonuclease RelE of RelBE toxin-antitoxin system